MKQRANVEHWVLAEEEDNRLSSAQTNRRFRAIWSRRPNATAYRKA